MKTDRLIIILTCFLILPGLTLLGGCGGGGGNNPPPTTFKLTVATATVPTGTTLGALNGIITVPAGVELRTSATGEVLAEQITAAGNTAAGSPQTAGNYDSITRKLIFEVISPSAGFGNGECAAITFDITTGAAVTAADFIVASAQGKDYTTAATVPGVTISLQ